MKIPPALWMVLTGALMKGAAILFPRWGLAGQWRAPVALVLILGAGMLVGYCGWMFKVARTTVSPVTPGAATSLVTTGIYSKTRNPMYLCMLLALVAWAVFLGNFPAVVLPLGFVWVMNKFQISAEEAALERLFGAQYAAYRTKVRRWI